MSKRKKQDSFAKELLKNGAWSRGRTGTPLRTRDFKSRVSTNSTTQALLLLT